MNQTINQKNWWTGLVCGSACVISSGQRIKKPCCWSFLLGAFILLRQNGISRGARDSLWFMPSREPPVSRFVPISVWERQWNTKARKRWESICASKDCCATKCCVHWRVGLMWGVNTLAISNCPNVSNASKIWCNHFQHLHHKARCQSSRYYGNFQTQHVKKVFVLKMFGLHNVVLRPCSVPAGRVFLVRWPSEPFSVWIGVCPPTVLSTWKQVQRTGSEESLHLIHLSVCYLRFWETLWARWRISRHNLVCFSHQPSLSNIWTWANKPTYICYFKKWLGYRSIYEAHLAQNLWESAICKQVILSKFL